MLGHLTRGEERGSGMTKDKRGKSWCPEGHEGRASCMAWKQFCPFPHSGWSLHCPENWRGGQWNRPPQYPLGMRCSCSSLWGAGAEIPRGASETTSASQWCEAPLRGPRPVLVSGRSPGRGALSQAQSHRTLQPPVRASACGAWLASGCKVPAPAIRVN